MSDQNIFGNQNPDPSQTPAQNQTPGGSTPGSVPSDVLATMLSSIKNERGEPKYRTVEDALIALKHSQEYIPTLKQELDATKSQLTEAQIQAAKIKELEQTVLALTQNNGQQETPPASLSEEKVAELVTATLNRVTTESKQRENIAAVTTKMKEVFGDKASDVFYTKANELGMSNDEINTLAAKNPQLVYKLFDIGTANSPPRSSNGSTVNTAAFMPAPDSSLSANKVSVLVGATTEQVLQESRNAKKLVDELHAQGKTTYDLTDPTVYFQVFK